MLKLATQLQKLQCIRGTQHTVFTLPLTAVPTSIYLAEALRLQFQAAIFFPQVGNFGIVCLAPWTELQLSL